MTASPTGEELVDLNPAVVNALADVGLEKSGRINTETFLSTIEAKTESLPQPSAPRPSVWPPGNGMMATKVREYDWAQTSLGAVSTWPQGLRTAVELMLPCRFPMVVLWGEHFIQIYNDGHCDIMGRKHPAGLGQPTEECWPEVWHINRPIYAKVMQGETLTFEDGLYPVRRKQELEDAYFTLCYSPLREEAGAIQGVLVTVFETTERLKAELQKISEASPTRALRSWPQEAIERLQLHGAGRTVTLKTRS